MADRSLLQRLAPGAGAIALLLAVVALAIFTTYRNRPPHMEPFNAQTPLDVLQDKRILPRNIPLQTFNPHRPDFTCAREADKVPPITLEAETAYQQAMALTNPSMWPKEQDWPQALELWERAAQLGHWKALMMVADTLQDGRGHNSEKGQFRVGADSERAVLALEQGMRLGIPEAFYRMGIYHEQGIGVNRSVDRAWAFYEIAADLGNARAQTLIGKSLKGSYDNPKEGFWGNRVVGLELLECAYSQNSGQAAYELGLTLDGEADRNPSKSPTLHPRALRILHDAVKFGSEDAAHYLSSSFRHMEPLVGHRIDRNRADRYSALGDALYSNPDLRFPNLDKVLPLPPAELPTWNGVADSLIDAAKPVILKTSSTSKPYLVVRGIARHVDPPVKFDCHGLRPCPATAIWWGLVATEHPEVRAFNRWDRQAYVRQGHAFPDPRDIGLAIEPQEVRWTLMGQANRRADNGFDEIVVE